jgi:hypothetical protein
LQIGIQPDKFCGIEKSPPVMQSGAPFYERPCDHTRAGASGIFP